MLELIRRPVERELARHGGDVDAAIAALVKKAIPDAMASRSRAKICGGRPSSSARTSTSSAPPRCS
ncbi:CUE domain-containing protein [Kitasatospora herbaricolor]|uniref:CUE domain-containing protein n=1 Tax=Kitasatospora herbaricolor TaxID=68217 RepID=A0ABZ1WJL3_9ACTN|nr:CUE domain-containing protein [Kitasatospora herbaricolor]